MIEYLLDFISGEAQDPLETMLARVSAAPGFLPFSEPVTGFVAALSQRILTDRTFRQHPELMAMAHWFRPANLAALRGDLFSRAGKHGVLVRRGVVFHLAPSNVDSVFIYSWLISLLCGNSNIARVSQRRSEQMQMFFSAANELLRCESFEAIANGNLVLSYGHDLAITEKISAGCHLRVIWGGDATVNQIRAVPLPALAAELAFANRFALAVLDASAILALDEPGLITVVQGFYNDVFWFNQQACSSPRAVVWVGTPEARAAARRKFWPALEFQVNKRQPENLPAQVMDRVTTMFRLAHHHEKAKLESDISALPGRMLVAGLDAEDRTCHDGNGLFLELEREDLPGVVPLLASRDQTLVYFGFERKAWMDLIGGLPPHAADRIVPVGEALTFGAVWDGVDLLRAFTREIQLQIAR